MAEMPAGSGFVMTEPREPEEIEIGRQRRWPGLLSYSIVFAAVAGVLAWLLGRFTNSIVLAVVLVGFMAGYILLMGYLASRHRN